jgi:hypothetical protein
MVADRFGVSNHPAWLVDRDRAEWADPYARGWPVAPVATAIVRADRTMAGRP